MQRIFIDLHRYDVGTQCSGKLTISCTLLSCSPVPGSPLYTKIVWLLITRMNYSLWYNKIVNLAKSPDTNCGPLSDTSWEWETTNGKDMPQYSNRVLSRDGSHFIHPLPWFGGPDPWVQRGHGWCTLLALTWNASLHQIFNVLIHSGPPGIASGGRHSSSVPFQDGWHVAC